jgi:CSLREA domain-containing protein
MGIVTRCTPWLLAFVCMDCGAGPGGIVVNDFGDAGPGNCTTTCTLRDAISTALATVPPKTVTFSGTASWPQTVSLTLGQLTINNTSGSTFSVIGPGTAKLAISANNLSRVLQVSAGSSDISNLTVRDGNVTGTSPGTEPGGTGNFGKTAGDAIGGCIAIGASATLALTSTDVRNCVAIGGTGGNGGSGVTNGGSGGSGGTGGNGGPGGAATGGAIHVAGNLSLIHSSVVNASATSGAGGNGGNGGDGTFGNGAGGNAGPGGSAAGAGIAIATGGSLLIRNTTLAGATATASNGGNGGNGGLFNPSGNGGNGGNVTGGLLYAGSSVVVTDLEFATLANGTIVAGNGGFPGANGSTIGAGGQPGVARGTGIYASGPNSAVVRSSIVVGAGVSLCFGSVAIDPGSVNLDQDSSCPGFTLHDTVAHVLVPLNLATTSWPGYQPVFHSSVVDAAADCNQIGGAVAVADDQHFTPRPQGAKCDLGAIESDYVFANGFD